MVHPTLTVHPTLPGEASAGPADPQTKRATARGMTTAAGSPGLPDQSWRRL